ncbi:hypothetical protein JTB14_013983 [Gonioctena quinquepunctata]|nr:hypothetical protein JTB14_013983 [Gonioctena quinquepunctata]
MSSDEENDAHINENNFEENHVPPTEYLVSTLNKDQKIESEAKTYLSEDTYAGTDDDDFVAPLDLLNSIISPSLPPHELTLKRGAIVKSEESDVEENQFHDDVIDDVLEQIDLDNINRQNDMFVHQNLDDFVPDDVADEIWPKDAVPFRTRSQLLARVAIQDRPEHRD